MIQVNEIQEVGMLGPNELALIRTGGSDATVVVELWGADSKPIPLGDNPYKSITVSSTAKGLMEFLAVPGAERAVGGCLKVSSGSNVAFNYGANGYELPTNLKPTSSSPNVVLIGETLYFGRRHDGAIRPGQTVLVDSTGASPLQTEDVAITEARPYMIVGVRRKDTAAATAGDGDVTDLHVGSVGELQAGLATLLAGENQTFNRMMTLPKYTPFRVTSDTTVKTGAGVVHNLVFARTDAAPTAGTIDIYDGTSAAGTLLLSWPVTTTVFETPFHLILDWEFAVGLFIDFTTTADVAVSGGYI